MSNTRDTLRKLAVSQEREAMRNGVVLRAQTIPNKKRQANRQACRNRKAWT